MFLQGGFFRNAPLIRHSIVGLLYLNTKYKVLIVSSAMESPNNLVEKLGWLKMYFTFITWEQIIFCGKKDAIKGDIMIDDCVENLDYFEGEKILFTQPYNMLIDSPAYCRVEGWDKIMEIL